ncbi:MAG: type I-F CRISPR-associated endoribonuclease Cas6/Csy4 [Chlamydiia bacterium]|nr:type I-F CRISPR-associated endoribonuclease Cas6/Csy4 [Chlamydiia bacterium]
MRLHGPLEALASLVKSDWLKRFIDHVQVSGLLSVPGNCHYVSVSRVQPKLSRARIRRGVKRGIFTEAEAYQLLEGRAQMDRPFLMLRSGSSGQSYPFYLEQSLPTPQRVMGDFNAFGLSRTATVPWF